MLNESQLEAKITDIEVINPNGIKPTFANNSTLLAGPNEIRIVFGEIFVEYQNATPKQEIRAHIVLTIAHAEALANSLATAVKGSKDLQAANEAKVQKA